MRGRSESCVRESSAFPLFSSEVRVNISLENDGDKEETMSEKSSVAEEEQEDEEEVKEGGEGGEEVV